MGSVGNHGLANAGGRGRRVASVGQRGGERGGRLIRYGAHRGLILPAGRGRAARHPSLPCGKGGPDDEQAQAEGRQPGRDGADGDPAHDAGGGLCDGQHPGRRQQWTYHTGGVLEQQGVAAQTKGCEAEQPVGVGACGQQQQRFPPPHPAPPPDQPGNADQFQDAERCRGQEQQRAVLDPAALEQVINLFGTMQESPAQIGDQVPGSDDQGDDDRQRHMPDIPRPVRAGPPGQHSQGQNSQCPVDDERPVQYDAQAADQAGRQPVQPTPRRIAERGQRPRDEHRQGQDLIRLLRQREAQQHRQGHRQGKRAGQQQVRHSR